MHKKCMAGRNRHCIGTIYVRRPFVERENIFIAGVRASYSDWMLKLVKIPEIRESSTFFYDANLKITHRFKDKSSLSLSGYTTYDRFRYASDLVMAGIHKRQMLLGVKLLTTNFLPQLLLFMEIIPVLFSIPKVQTLLAYRMEFSIIN